MVLMQPAERHQALRLGLLGPILQEYAHALGTPIHAYAPPNRLSPPRRGGGLHLHLFALPARPHGFPLWPVAPSLEIDRIFSWGLAAGHALAPGSLFFQGVLKVDQGGRAIAGTLGENFYVLFDLLGQPAEWIPVILRRTLDLCLEGSAELISQKTGRLAHQVQITLNRLSHTTTLLSLDHPASRGEDLGTDDGDFIGKQITVVEENLKELSRQMASQTRLLLDCRARFRTLDGAEQFEEVLAREFDGLLGIPEVQDVEVRADRLCVLTDTLDAVMGGRRYRLGRFRVEIRFNGEVAIRNLTRPYGYYDHPHVWNGKPCLGNIHQCVLKLVGEFQWVAAAEVLLEYLKSVNPKGWYIPITHWEELRA
jgi:hypothetical protein